VPKIRDRDQDPHPNEQGKFGPYQWTRGIPRNVMTKPVNRMACTKNGWVMMEDVILDTFSV
jgi:hypothetical protein